MSVQRNGTNGGAVLPGDGDVAAPRITPMMLHRLACAALAMGTVGGCDGPGGDSRLDSAEPNGSPQATETAFDYVYEADSPWLPAYKRQLFPIMPFVIFRNMEVADLLSIYVYLTNVPRTAEDPMTGGTALACSGGSDCPVGTCESGECIGAPCNNHVECPACQSCGGGSIPANTCGIDPAVHPGCSMAGM